MNSSGGLGIFLLIAICVGLARVIFAANEAAKGKDMMVLLDDPAALIGKTKPEIMALLGAPKSTSTDSNGTSQLGWKFATYSALLKFDGDVCRSVTKQAV